LIFPGMKEYEFYLFDLDGTILDTFPIILASFQHVLTTMAGIHKTDTELTKYIGIPLRQQYRLFSNELRPPPDDAVVDSWFEAHLAFQKANWKDTVKAHDGAVETLKALKLKNKKMAVVTSRTRPSAEMFMRGTGIWDFFDAVLTPETTDKHKPHPGPALKALELLDGRAEDAIFIGDAIFDIQCGSAAGLHTCYVSYETPPLYPHTDVFPTYRIRNLRELLTF